MKVSVCITTYNHERYIKQALDSVLCQETDFEFEVLIGEDGSTDHTREIVTAYQKAHPEKIRLFLNDRANVIYIDGKPTGRWNFMNLLGATKGQYVAILDGDDYWIVNSKLQSQVDFLDANPDCAICFHNALEYQVEEGIFRPFHNSPFRRITGLIDLLDFNYIPTCTVMYRRSSVPALPSWFKQIRMADWPLHLLTAQSGSVGYIDEMMACYRQHSQGSWYGLRLVDKYKYIIKAYKIFKLHFAKDKAVVMKIDKMLALQYDILAKLLKEKKMHVMYWYYLLMSKLYSNRS